ncbi:MAG: DNA-binding protein WhiA [Clostridia bacterium]|nr:DNA-binding protein WhiA [Clostridia bacterium]
MSFSTQLKQELLSIENIKPCCMLSETYGLILFSKSFSKRSMFLNTENSQVAERYYSCINRLAVDGVSFTKSDSGKCKVSVNSEASRLRVLSAFGFSGNERSRRINWANIENDCCLYSFIRGVFLACGNISDPEKSYHVEFCVPYSLKNDLLRVLGEIELKPKEIKRNNNYYLYFKDSEDILTLLASIGANNSVLEFTGVKIFKDMRNNINRKTNFENANLDRTVNAALVQTEAILKLKKQGKFNTLPTELRQLAQLRLDNPDLSLKEIGEMLEPPLSRSGVNHRLQKLINLSQ